MKKINSKDIMLNCNEPDLEYGKEWGPWKQFGGYRTIRKALGKNFIEWNE